MPPLLAVDTPEDAGGERECDEEIDWSRGSRAARAEQREQCHRGRGEHDGRARPVEHVQAIPQPQGRPRLGRAKQAPSSREIDGAHVTLSVADATASVTAHTWSLDMCGKSGRVTSRSATASVRGSTRRVANSR